MVFNATFNNISVISWRSVLMVRGNRRKPPTCHKSLTNFFTQCCIEYTSPWTGFKFTTLVVIDTDCTDSYKSNYHMTTTPTTKKKHLSIDHIRWFCLLRNDNVNEFVIVSFNSHVEIYIFWSWEWTVILTDKCFLMVHYLY